MTGDTMTARLIVRGVMTDVFNPFEMRDVMRSIPTRTYSKAAKCWTIETTFIDLCIISLESAGCTTFVTYPDGRPWTRRSSSSPRSSSSSSNSWVEDIFTACPPANVNRLRKSLLACFHPDVGGDADITRRIIAAAEKTEK